MANHVVERRAAGLRVSPVVQGRRHGVVLHGKIEDKFIDRFRRDSGPNKIGENIEGHRRKLTGPAHSLKRFRPMELYFPVIREPDRRAVFRSVHGDEVCARGALVSVVTVVREGCPWGRTPPT